MGVYIKSMRLPMFCDDCWMCQNSGGANELGDDFCCIGGSPIDDRAIRPDWCPLVPITEPHGRLIDAKYVRDTIIQEWMDKADDSHMYKRGMEDAYEVIRNAPTIIPAEEGE